MEPHKHGTCENCRWAEVIGDRAACHHTVDSDWNDLYDWCENWEPPEGRCCGSCANAGPDVRASFGYVLCALYMGRRHEADGCARWRWRGSGYADYNCQ